ncbi:MAG TPA: hypothetical protein PLG57_01030 [Bacteroidia bacterium]|nr:hypothetical protein [Bacteroidia bacterium]HQK96604.1 hypothetical protein [Bacteroidia bacterium]
MYRKLFLIVILVCLNVFKSFSQANAKSYNLVVEIPTFTEEKTLPYLLSAISSTTGVVLKEYCAYQGWIVIEVNNERFSCTEDPMYLLKQLQIEGILKVGATKEQVEAYCKGGLNSSPNIKK